MYTTRPLFTRRGMAEYRQTIKGRLKHWRKLCNLSQVQAAKVAGVARSTWQAWENPARSALPGRGRAGGPVADAARVDPAGRARLADWRRRAQAVVKDKESQINLAFRLSVSYTGIG